MLNLIQLRTKGNILLKGLVFLTLTLPVSSVTIASEPTAEQSAITQLQTALNTNKGKVIYVDFWASWCKPCRQSFPWMNQMKRKYGAEGLKIITVNLDKEHQLAEQFLKENPADFQIIFDPKGETAEKFALQGMPMSFVFDRNGKPQFSHVGFITKKIPQYESELNQLLKTKGEGHE
ncbi:TlpA disulfide reductase family protein [Aliikangiella sp. G2MR2-5]|uniref:TlpA disulfide reductase family protein n=1 Tax=Aliikangiella sp. G2MR2-5 TaxID=2788943 RepID=UPI0018AB4511|nr:TlpA disulfide reductase family protein [Aliikangiella sp. G2MR2-5]